MVSINGILSVKRQTCDVLREQHLACVRCGEALGSNLLCNEEAEILYCCCFCCMPLYICLRSAKLEFE